MKPRKGRRGPPGLLVDTGFVIGLLDKDDDFHAAALRWDRQLADRPRILTTAVLLECGDGFAEHDTWRALTTWLDHIARDPRYELVNIDHAMLTRTRAFRDQHPTRAWSFTDCTSFVVMKARGITEAFSTDKHFNEAGFDALLLRP